MLRVSQAKAAPGLPFKVDAEPALAVEHFGVQGFPVFIAEPGDSHVSFPFPKLSFSKADGQAMACVCQA